MPCNSAYFVVPHRMDSNIHRDIYLLTMKEAIYYVIFSNNVPIQLCPFNKHFTMLACSIRVEGLRFYDV